MISDGPWLDKLQQGRCPECGCRAWQPGPRGGASQNFECVMCKKRFNIVIIGKAVIMAERIGASADWTHYRKLYGIGPLLQR